MNDNVQLIKEKLSIVDVVASYTELKKAGRHFKGKSPFTNENTPSFFVSPDRGMYYCFSSSKGGDIFTFIEEMEGVDFKGALAILAERAGVELVREDPKKRNERDKKFALVETATKFFEDKLAKNEKALKYLKDRGVNKESIKKWRIGYAPDAWRELKIHLAESGFSIKEMQSSGLIKGDEGKEPYDVFRDRLMFPIVDASGRVAAFSGRLLGKDDNVPKYVNSPETELFNKSEILYGYDKAKHGIRKFDFSLIVEGQFDLVLAHQAGYHNSVAVSGTALSEHHVMLLGRLSNRVVLALDADKAGIEAVKRATHLMLARGMDVKVANIEEGKDPADIITEDPEKFKKLVGNSTHVIEFLLAILKLEAKDIRSFKLRAREEILPYLLRIPDRIDREHFEDKIAKTIGATKEAIHHEVERLAQKSVTNSLSTQNKTKVGNVVSITKRSEGLVEYLVVMSHALSETKEMKKNGKKLQAILSDPLDIAVENILEGLATDVKSKLLFGIEAEIESISEQTLYDDIVSKLTELHTYNIKSKINDIKKKMQEAEMADDNKKLDKLLKVSSRLQKELSSISYDKELFESK